MIRFPESSYDCIPLLHPKLGILMNNSPINWFTSSELCIPAANPKEVVASRTTYLPHANDIKLLEALHYEESLDDRDFVVIGYGPTVQAVCHILGDVIGTPNVQILKECVRDENMERCQAFLDYGLMFKEEVTSLVDFIESMDLLHERLDDLPSAQQKNDQPPQKYVCDCDRGGHLSLFMFYLLRDHGYIQWPRQPWFQDITKNAGQQYWCPLGRRVVDLCDEPQFSSSTRFFLNGRQWLDEKDLLHQLVPELMPPTFHSLEEAQKYSISTLETCGPHIWFLKKVNQNGGRAVEVRHDLPTQPLESDEQLQAHIPRPLLFEKASLMDGNEVLRPHKCHVKTYQWIGCTKDDTTNKISWQLYMHDLYYLATADKPFDPKDISDPVQITTMRTHRLYDDTPWRVQWGLTEKCRTRMETVLRRAIEQGKLQSILPSSASEEQTVSKHEASNSKSALQFEINSADWMLDEDGNMYLIECNGIPVLYAPEIKQPLITRGLNLYDGLYKQNPKDAIVNDTDLLREAVGLAMTGKLPKKTLWKHIATIPCPS
eukprot:CAMPEP_0178905642 /NCGR_PEP_ID=MMETSP0786-20121207/6388_1 /TAXON_ID=186022 /ORGANISM="Thalassionema frauenfeldii, Strain CCMP 1798" /LENGTH=544 /DNA_ID=CAMNT_0020577271 /DNA_START=149 /DNA_END=1783 /DNA_ORIENTATION=+